jgi:hypothetical protein
VISEVHDVLKEAGASEEKARKAAEATASSENSFTRIEEGKLIAIRGEQNLLRWMIGFNLAVTIAILWKVFSS